MALFYFRHHELVFLHIPKTGGTSIRVLFRDEQAENDCVFGVPPSDWPMHRSFTIVREPINRFISGLAYVRKVYNYTNTVEAILEMLANPAIPCDNQSSNPAVSRDIFTKEAELCSEMDVLVLVKHHLIKQTDPYWHLDKIVHIGRFETIQQDFDQICNTLSAKTHKLPHTNKSDKSGISLTQQEISLVVDFYRSDFEQLKYQIP